MKISYIDYLLQENENFRRTSKLMIKSLIIRFFEAFSKPAHISVENEEREEQKINHIKLSFRNMTQKAAEAKIAQEETRAFYEEAVKQMLNYKPPSRDNYAREPFFGNVLMNGWRIKS